MRRTIRVILICGAAVCCVGALSCKDEADAAAAPPLPGAPGVVKKRAPGGPPRQYKLRSSSPSNVGAHPPGGAKTPMY